MYRTNLRDVPTVEGLKRDDGWVDMQVQFLIDKKWPAPTTSSAGPCSLGARHENHRHHNCDESSSCPGHAHHTEAGESAVRRRRRDLSSSRGCWHGFNNTSAEDVVLVWGWMDAGSIEASGYEVHPDSHR